MSRLRVAFRTLRRRPGFTTVAVLSLGVAIALNTTMYSVLATLLDPRLNARQPANVHHLAYFAPSARMLSAADIAAALNDGVRGYEGVSGAISKNGKADARLVEYGARYKRLAATIVQPNFFDFLGARASSGRTFLPRDEGTANVVISDRLARYFFGDSPAVGQPITVDGNTQVVIGVVQRSPSFEPLAGDVFILRPPAALAVPVTLIRLRSLADTTAVKAELAVVAARLALATGDAPSQARFRFKPIPLRMQLGVFHKAIGGAVLAVLLVACANLANMQLARGLARSRELAIRAAVGASRRQLVGDLVLESALLAAFGMVLGIVLTLWGISVVRATVPPEIENHVVAPVLSWGMFAFAAVAAIVCLFLVGLLPAVRVARVDPVTLLQAGSGTGATRGHRRRYGFMVVAQIALALPVLIASVVALKGASRYHDAGFFATQWFGYDPTPVVEGGVAYDAKARPLTVSLVSAEAEIVSRTRQVPNVLDASIDVARPPGKWMVTVDGVNGETREMMAHSWMYHVVSPSFFRVYGRPMARGRDFTDGDAGGPAVIMDAPSARYLWGFDDPIGRSIKFANAATDAPWYRVVGIVGDMRDSVAIRRAMPDANYRLYGVYRTVAPTDTLVAPPGRNVWIPIHARARQNRELASLRIQRELRTLGRGERVTAESLEAWIAQSRITSDWVAGLFTAFALVGLALVVIGVYGIVRHSVEERRHELAVRISIGATARDILRAVLREGNVLILVGIAIGLFLTKFTVWWLGEFVFDNDGYDSQLFALISAGLFIVALVSALIPAVRATRINAVEALRHE